MEILWPNWTVFSLLNFTLLAESSKPTITYKRPDKLKPELTGRNRLRVYKIFNHVELYEEVSTILKVRGVDCGVILLLISYIIVEPVHFDVKMLHQKSFSLFFHFLSYIKYPNFTSLCDFRLRPWLK